MMMGAKNGKTGAFSNTQMFMWFNVIVISYSEFPWSYCSNAAGTRTGLPSKN